MLPALITNLMLLWLQSSPSSTFAKKDDRLLSASGDLFIRGRQGQSWMVNTQLALTIVVIIVPKLDPKITNLL